MANQTNVGFLGSEIEEQTSSATLANSLTYAPKIPATVVDNRERLAFYIDTTAVGRWWELFDSFINLAFCFNYIVQTTISWKVTPPKDALPFQIFDIVLAAILLIQHLPSIYISFDRFGTLTSLYTILTFASTVPIFFAFYKLPENYGKYLGAGILAYWFPARFWRLSFSLSESIAPNKHVLSKLSLIAQKSLNVFLKIFVTLLTVAAWSHLALLRVGFDDKEKSKDLTFFDVFYTITVTSTSGLSTGIIPDNVVSRLVVLSIMLVGAFYLPSNLAELLALMRQKSKYDKPYEPKRKQGEKIWDFKHVIVSGNINDVGALKGFFREFFCEGFNNLTL